MKRIYQDYLKDSIGSTRVGLEAKKDGLGLAIVKHIIEAHDEKIEVMSEKNMGTELYLL